MGVIITNVYHKRLGRFNSIRVGYDYKGGFGTLEVNDIDGEFKIDEVHMDYTLYNEDFKHICDHINNLVKGKKKKEVLRVLKGV